MVRASDRTAAVRIGVPMAEVDEGQLTLETLRQVKKDFLTECSAFERAFGYKPDRITVSLSIVASLIDTCEELLKEQPT